MATNQDPTRERLPIDPDVAPSDSTAPTSSGTPGRAGQHATRSSSARPSILIAIALGAALGAPARYGMAQLIHGASGSFPWATFAINISGSLILGMFMALILERFPPTRYLRPFFATGFLGAYTTYSTFAVETDLLVRYDHAAIGLAYAAASLAAGFVAVWAGIWIARTIPMPYRGGTP